MTFKRAWDGLPRELPISRHERARLRARMWAAAHKDARPASARQIAAALVPGAIMLAAMAIWMPLIYWRGSGLPLWATTALVALVIAASFVVQMALIRRLTWPLQCRLMARAGYEVCPACAFPMQGIAPDQRTCPECGAPRVTDETSAPAASHDPLTAESSRHR